MSVKCPNCGYDNEDSALSCNLCQVVLRKENPAAPAPAAVAEHKAGDLIGQKYQVHGVLGRGGFGVVYKALGLHTLEVFALKTFLDEYLADAQTREQFRKEAQVWVDLDRHPYLVRAHLVDQITGRLYLVMEMVTAGRSGLNSLDAFLRHQPPSLALALRWAVQFCHGMEYAYSKGIRCHRDIKPANILISQDQTVKISDFGLAAVLGTSKALTGRVSVSNGAVGLSAVQGGGFGTPTHMPPEQFTDAASCDARSDIYAFGVVLFQLASKGRLPFLAPPPKDGSAAESQRFWVAMYRLHAQAPVPASDSPLAPIIARCLQKSPLARYQSFAELRAELEAALKKGSGETVAPPTLQEYGVSEWNDKAVSLANLKRFEDALRCYDKALELDGRNSAVWNNRGNCLVDLGRREEALACYDKALELDPANAGAWTDKGLELQAMGRLDDALACFMKASAIDPLIAAHAVAEGNCYDLMERYEDAIRSYDYALKLDAEHVYAWHNKGGTLRRMGRLQEAVQAFVQALQRDPLLAPAWICMGETLGDLGAADQALAAFEKALALEPDNAAVWADKGAALSDLGRHQEALPCLDRAVALAPKLARAWNNRATTLTRLGRIDEALSSAEQAVALDASKGPYWLNKATALYALGRFPDAALAFAKTLESDPENGAVYLFAGDCLRNLKRFEQALLFFDKARQFLKPGSRSAARAYHYQGLSLHSLGRKDEALASYAQALAIWPEFPEALAAQKACAAGGPPPA